MTALMTVKEVAAVLGVHVNTVYALTARGVLPHYRVGGRGKGALRFDEAGVRQYLAAQLQAARTSDRHETGLVPAPEETYQWLRT